MRRPWKRVGKIAKIRSLRPEGSESQSSANYRAGKTVGYSGRMQGPTTAVERSFLVDHVVIGRTIAYASTIAQRILEDLLLPKRPRVFTFGRPPVLMGARSHDTKVWIVDDPEAIAKLHPDDRDRWGRWVDSTFVLKDHAMFEVVPEKYL